MKRKALLMGAIVILFVSTSLFAQTKLRSNIPLHHFQLSCNTCHAPKSTDYISENQDETNIGKVKGDINKLCTSSGCHDFEPSLNHPVGVRANSMTTGDMPLDSYSRITCLTCHDAPQSSDTLDFLDESQQRLLHKPEGIQFCGSCHMQMDGTLQEQSHWQFSARAHLDSISPKSSNSDYLPQVIGRIDVESRTCLSCHDEISATITDDNETPHERKLRWSSMSSHPIGMNYDNKAAQRAGQYQFPLLGQKVRLFDGRMGCGSCHSPYSQIKNNLVMRNERGTLCRTCHNK